MAQTKPKAGQFYGVSNNGTDGEFLQTDGTGGMAWASPITNPTITSIDYPGSATAALPAGGESVIINGTLFASGITCTVGGTSAVTAFNSATQITITTPAKAAGPYTVAVTNTNGGTASENNFIQYSGVPVWSTAAGTLGNVLEGEAASFQVTATEGSDTIEYAVTTGTLPTGLSLATATGAITGTAPTVSADTTTTFSITATDDENQTSSERSFSITVQNNAPSNHFNTVLYTGNDVSHAITGVGFEPSLVWIKRRNTAEDHALYDSVRGINKQLSSNLTAAQATNTAPYEGFTSFDADGFTLNNNGATNRAPNTYVAWNFKAGGAAVANTDGDIDSQVSVNNSLGFSIVSWTSSSTDSNTIGSGLNERVEFLITKKYSGSRDWIVWHKDLPNNGYLSLNNTIGESTPNDYRATVTNDTTFIAQSVSGDLMIAYCFASKPGFSKVGSYTGNGSVSGPMVQTGFEPAFLMIKSASSSGTAWNMWDNKRTPYDMLRANTSEAEFAGPGRIQFFANGFQLLDADASRNSSGGNYIYLAFAADGSTATPSLANSFATEIYTGNGGTKSVTTGFKPDFTWVKARNVAYNHGLVDSVRGTTSLLYPDLAQAASTGVTNAMQSFDSNGFTWGSNNKGNANGTNYVSWNFKTGITPSINTDGTITSVVSANQAAGFSIVKYNGNSNSGTVGHGLSQTPELFFIKTLSMSAQWLAINTSSQMGGYLSLTDSFTTARYNAWLNNANPTNTIIPLGAYNYVSGDMIMYCFTSISGYSKVGTYTGLGSGGPLTVNMGFAPTLGLIKKTTGTGGWRMFDTVRGTNKSLRANEPLAEYVDSANYMDFTSTGFYFSTSQTNSDINAAGETYIYLAIKEN